MVAKKLTFEKRKFFIYNIDYIDHFVVEDVMELKHLRTFLTVVEQGSYHRAAQMLGYTQSTITVQIQQLEEELGVPLFERVGRRMVLTQMGGQVLGRARTLLEEADQLASLARTGQELAGTLRVDMAETLLCYQMQPVIRAFRAQAPQVRLIIRGCNCMKIPQNLRDGLCDLGVGYDIDWDRGMLQAEPLGEYEIVLLAAPTLQDTDFTTPHQRKRISLVTDEPDSLFRRQLEAYLQERDIILDTTIELWSIETIKRCVMSDLGFTFLPRFAAREELSDGRLVELSAPISGMRAPVLCARHKNRWITPAMELFQALLRSHVQGFPCERFQMSS